VSTASRGSQSGSGISFQTLAIASLSSLAAALVVHKVWGGGAIVGAAITPVIVGIVGEALRRPVDKLSAPREGGRRLPADRAHDVPPASRQRGDDPFGLWEQERRRSSRGRTWLVLGLVTGVIGFAIAAFVLTGSELVFGGSVAGGPKKTTIFGGGRTTTTVQTVTRTTTTPTATTPTVTQTVPVPAQGTTAPATTVPPATTTPPTQQAQPQVAPTTSTQPPATTSAP
jgi:hypothetical protein